MKIILALFALGIFKGALAQEQRCPDETSRKGMICLARRDLVSAQGLVNAELIKTEKALRAGGLTVTTIAPALLVKNQKAWHEYTKSLCELEALAVVGANPWRELKELECLERVTEERQRYLHSLVTE